MQVVVGEGRAAEEQGTGATVGEGLNGVESGAPGQKVRHLDDSVPVRIQQGIFQCLQAGWTAI